MNNKGPQDRSAADDPRRSGADGRSKQPPRQGSARFTIPPDDRLTTILPPVTDDIPNRFQDPVDAVKAALDGRPAARSPEQRDPLEMASAALDAKTPPRTRQPSGSPPPSGPPKGPPHRKPPLPGWAQRLDWEWLNHINRRWVRRGVLVGAVVLLLLPIVTFAMAYMIVDIPRPGDIRTNQVSTILASDGSELAKIVPPEGNRVDVNLEQVPVHVRQAVIAAEDRNFYSNPGFSFTGFARAFKNNMFGGDTQGGSTITQQYVKNALVGAQRAGVGGLIRKAKELVIATKMTGEWSKDDVLQAYL
ncbi:MAG: hypothetical protein QOI33_731, partial [Mycobacterium sp.]|nr:hypothetical protein [Mycobacterium sp.]